MWKDRLKSKPLTILGLMFGIIGAVLLAFSVEIIDPWIPPPALTHATIIQERFWLGVILLALGFGFQFFGVILEK
jgi:hypothetical protein